MYVQHEQPLLVWSPAPRISIPRNAAAPYPKFSFPKCSVGFIYGHLFPFLGVVQKSSATLWADTSLITAEVHSTQQAFLVHVFHHGVEHHTNNVGFSREKQKWKAGLVKMRLKEGFLSAYSWPGTSAEKRSTLLGFPKIPGKDTGPSFKKSVSPS